MPEQPADYALVPNAVCWHPPVRHRHSSYWARRLTLFNLYLLGGVLIAARAALWPFTTESAATRKTPPPRTIRGGARSM